MDNINRSIIEQLATAAQEYFTHLKCDPGTYTDAELAQNRHPVNKKLPAYIAPESTPEHPEFSEYADETLTLAAGGFTASIPRAQLFRLLDKFENLERVRKDSRAKFVRTANADADASFAINIPSGAETLAKCVWNARDGYRPNIEHIVIDVENNAIFATDTHILNVVDVEIEASSQFPAELTCAINPKHIAKLTGRCQFNASAKRLPNGDVDNICCAATNEYGEQYRNEYGRDVAGCTVNYRKAMPGQLRKSDFIKLTPESLKLIVSLCSKAKDEFLIIKSHHGSIAATATLISADKETNNITELLSAPLELEHVAHGSRNVCIAAKHIKTLSKTLTGGVWIAPKICHPALFETSTGCALVMPSTCNTIHDTPVDDSEPTFPWDWRFRFIPEAKPTIAAKKQRKPRRAVASSTPEQSTTEDLNVELSGQVDAYASALLDAIDTIKRVAALAELNSVLARATELAELAGVELKAIIDSRNTQPKNDTLEPLCAACDTSDGKSHMADKTTRYVAAMRPTRPPTPIANLLGGSPVSNYGRHGFTPRRRAALLCYNIVVEDLHITRYVGILPLSAKVAVVIKDVLTLPRGSPHLLAVRQRLAKLSPKISQTFAKVAPINQLFKLFC